MVEDGRARTRGRQPVRYAPVSYIMWMQAKSDTLSISSLGLHSAHKSGSEAFLFIICEKVQDRCMGER